MAAPKLSGEELLPIRRKLATLSRLSTNQKHQFWLYVDPRNGKPAVFEYDDWYEKEIEVLSLLADFAHWEQAKVLSQVNFLDALLINSIKSYRDLINNFVLTKRLPIVSKSRLISEFLRDPPEFK